MEFLRPTGHTFGRDTRSSRRRSYLTGHSESCRPSVQLGEYVTETIAAFHASHGALADKKAGSLEAHGNGLARRRLRKKDVPGQFARGDTFAELLGRLEQPVVERVDIHVRIDAHQLARDPRRPLRIQLHDSEM